VQIELFIDNPNEDREKFIRNFFNKKLTIKKRKKNFEYVPISKINDEYLIARIGRTSLVRESLPPDELLEEVLRPSWQAAYIIIDPRSHNDGQKIAIEETIDVGRPAQIVRSLVDKINLNPNRKYQVDFEPIQNASDFWRFANENKGEITSLKFEFIAPNMWDSENELENELREMRNAEHAHRVNLELKNQDGINTDTKMVESGVARVEHGGGNVKARAKNRKRFDSSKRIAQTFLEESSEEGTGLYYQINSSAARILGNDES